MLSVLWMAHLLKADKIGVVQLLHDSNLPQYVRPGRLFARDTHVHQSRPENELDRLRGTPSARQAGFGCTKTENLHLSSQLTDFLSLNMHTSRA